MAILKLGGSVGSGANNDPGDVAKVVNRFVELGYNWVSGFTKGTESELIRTIKLFQSTCKGEGKASNGDGKIDLHGNTHKWLAAENAPKWVKVFGEYGLGWTSTARIKPTDYKEKNGGYATSWLLDGLHKAGMVYNAKAIGIKDAPLYFWVRECSPVNGGDAYGHKSHETGIDVDIRLPLLPPHTNEWFQLKAHNYTKLFHVDAAMEQCKAIKAWMGSRYIFFNDPRFTGAGLTSHQSNHSEHYHVRIKPPTRVEGIYI